MRFSQRIGKTPVKTVLQVESMDVDLKNRLWNMFIEIFFEKIDNYNNYGETKRGLVAKKIWVDFYNFTVDTIPENYDGYISASGVLKYIREWFFEFSKWHEIYDFLEFTVELHPVLSYWYNVSLEKEVSAYRFINGKVTQITSEGEVAEIEEALIASDEWKSVNTHLNAALNFLADRKNPDYRNSIKESISAVESLCLKIGGNTNGKFGDALTEIEKKMPLHGSLKTAFKALYGYTSDAGGIRHALIDDGATPSFEEAKFMLVSCSAFINYLKAKMQL